MCLGWAAKPKAGSPSKQLLVGPPGPLLLPPGLYMPHPGVLFPVSSPVPLSPASSSRWSAPILLLLLPPPSTLLRRDTAAAEQTKTKKESGGDRDGINACARPDSIPVAGGRIGLDPRIPRAEANSGPRSPRFRRRRRRGMRGRRACLWSPLARQE